MLNHKRIMSLALAGIMSAALAVPAFAATAPNTTTVTATYEDVPIAVSVPTTGTACINPYALPYSIGSYSETTGTGDDAKTTTTDVKVSGQQIVTKALTVRNEGTDVDLKVGVSATATMGKGTMSLSATAPEADSTKKLAFVYFEIVETELSGTVGADATDQNVLTAISGDEFWGTYDKDAKNMVVLTSGKAAVSTDTGVVLTKVKTAATAAVGKEGETGYVAAQSTEYDEGSIAAFHLAGSVVQAPSDAWTTKDSFTTAIAFTFTPSTDD